MNKVKCHIKNHKQLYILLLISVAVFAVLYRHLLAGAYIYAYSDIGSDTLNTYLPRLLYDGRWLQAGQTSGYAFSFGLGTYLANPLFKYLLPWNWVFIGCTVANIGQCLLLSLFLKVICTVIFAYLYFKKITQDAYAGMVGGLIWSFCSYMIIWGQHYQYATWICLFTIGMYVLELYLEDRSVGLLLIPVFAFMLLETYYELYMNGIFMAIYIVVRTGFMTGDRKARHTIRKLVVLAAMAVASALMACVRLLPDIQQFFASTRSSELAVEGVGLFFDRQYLLTFIARFLSPNLLHAGKDYTGAYNYYEAALLFVSLLSLYAFVYLIQTRYRARVLGLGILWGLTLLFPIVSQILNMNPGKQRWSYMLCLCVSICIAMFVAVLPKEDAALRKRRMIISLLIADVVYVLLMLVLVTAHKKGLLVLDKTSLLMVVILLAAFHAALLILAVGRQTAGCVSLMLVLIAEVLVMENPSINHRDMITKDAWDHGIYQDGTSQMAELIRAQEDDLYRINKTYTYTLGYNDPLVQNFSGVSVYSSVNTAELVNFYQTWGYDLLRDRSHYIMIPAGDYYLNSILGVRYVIAEPDTDMGEAYAPVLEDAYHVAYKNQYALPIAWQYHRQFDPAEATAVPIRGKAMAFGYFLTDTGEQQETLPDSAEAMTALEVQESDGLAAMSKLAEEGLQDARWDGKQLTGTITNHETVDTMLAFSIIYDKHWQVYVDGQQVQTYDINGGLLGARLAGGTHEIRVVYQQPGTMISYIISGVAWILYLVSMILIYKRKK